MGRTAPAIYPPLAPDRSGTKIAALIGGLVALYLLRYALLPFVVAAAAAYIVNPLVVAAERCLRTSRPIAGAAVFVAAVAMCVVVALWVGLPVWRDVRDIVLSLPESLHRTLAQLLPDRGVQVFGQSFDADRLTAAILEDLRSFFGAPRHALTLAVAGLAAVMGATLTLVLFFYFVVAGDRLVYGSARLVPAGRRARYFEILRRIDPVLGRYVRGVAAIAAYAIVASALGLTFLLRIPHPLFFAVASGLLELLPIVGPIVAALMVGAAVAQQASLWLMGTFVVYLTALRLSIDQLIGPLLLGRATALHPTVVIFALLAGGSIFGPAGLLLAVPVAVTVKIALAAAEAAD